MTTSHGFHPLSVFSHPEPAMRLSRHEFRYHRLSTRARLTRIQPVRANPVLTVTMSQPEPEPEHYRPPPIDWTRARSSMEDLAASWRK